MKLRWRRRRRWLGPLGIVPKVGPTHGVSGRHAPGHATMGVSLPLMACSGYSRRATSFQKECPDRWRNGTEFGYRGLTQTWHEKAAAGLRISDGLLRITSRGDVAPRLIEPYRPAVKEGLADTSGSEGCVGARGSPSLVIKASQACGRLGKPSG